MSEREEEQDRGRGGQGVPPVERVQRGVAVVTRGEKLVLKAVAVEFV